MIELNSETPRAIAIDWSGALRSKGKIWAAVAIGPRLESLLPQSSRECVIAWLIEQLEQPNAIAGLDFAFSMPAWFVRDEHSCDNAIAFWMVVKREGERWLKCCQYPFWGCKGTRKPRNCELFRETEKDVLNPAEKANPTSTFQLVGAS